VAKTKFGPYKKGDPDAKREGRKGGKKSAASRAVERLGVVGATLDALAPLTVLDFMDRFGLTGESWAVWRVVAKVLDGTPLDDAEMALYTELTGRTTLPKNLRTLWGIIGRRGGKSHFASVVAVHAASKRYPRLAAGEKARVVLLGKDREQGNVLYDFVAGMFDSDPELSRLVVSRTKSATKTEMLLAHNVLIQVLTSNFRSVRSYSVACAVCDEVSFWWSDEQAANPAKAVLQALRPTLATLRGRLLCVTSPFARDGVTYEVYRKHFANDESNDTLVLNSPTRRTNPTIDESEIRVDEAEDPESASAEWGGQFRADRETYVRMEALDAVTAVGITERPPQPGVVYKAAVDVSGGSGKDSFTLSIGHLEDGRWIQDVLREWRPPFSPGAVTGEVCGICSVYGITTVVGDRYAGGFPPEEFHGHGVKYVQAPRDASAYYVDALALINTGRVSLLDQPKCRRQFVALRRQNSSGSTKVTHPSSGHDDLSNVSSLGMVEALGLNPTRKRYEIAFSDMSPPAPRLTSRQEREREENARMLATIAVVQETLARQDERDHEISERYRDLPMTSEPVWRVHGTDY
jgi:hypothetical protein